MGEDDREGRRWPSRGRAALHVIDRYPGPMSTSKKRAAKTGRARATAAPGQRSRTEPLRTVLFLGAGASAAFGYPITSAILPRIRQMLDDGTLFPIASNPARERGRMQRLREHLVALFPTIFEESIELPLITDLLSLIDLMLTTEEILLPKVSAQSMQDLRTLLEHAILQVIEAEYRRPESFPGLDRLADWMLNGPEDAGAPVTVVSTNYDTLIDGLLFERIDIAPDLEIPTAVDMGFAWREHSSGRFNMQLHPPPAEPTVRLLKLHGSLNWLKCPLCGFVYINTAGSIHQQAFREEKIDYNNTCLCGHGPVRTVIVAPSMVRSIRDADLLTIWRSALEALRTADEWIIAGYSLPPEDITIRSILLRALHGRGKAKSPRIRVVQRSPDKSMEGRYRLLLPDCSFEYDGFEGFVKSLPKASRHFPVF